MTEFKNNHLKVGDRVRYLDRLPHDHAHYYSEWRDRCVTGLAGTVVEDLGGDFVVRLEGDNSTDDQIVHPDNLEKI